MSVGKKKERCRGTETRLGFYSDGWMATDLAGQIPRMAKMPAPAGLPLSVPPFSSRQDSDPSDVNVAGLYLSLQKRPLRMGSGGARLGGMDAVEIGNVDAETVAGVRG